MAGMAAVPSRKEGRHPFNTSRVRYSSGWLRLGAGAAGVGLLGMRRWGWPATLGMGTLGLASLAYITLIEPSRPRFERVTLNLPNLPPELDGLRIGQISDIHLGHPYSVANLDWAKEQMQREQPDLLIFTGDFVSKHRALGDVAPLLRGLSAPLGMYAVPGNHDYWEGLSELHSILASCGIPLMINEHRRLSWNGGEFWLVAVDDLWDGHPDLDVAMHGIPSGAFTLLLSHSPDFADEAAARGVSVQFSGHTHGGHMRLPGLGAFALPRHGWRYSIGHYQIGAMQLYVSRGLSGGPFRLLCPPEATIFTLRTSK